MSETLLNHNSSLSLQFAHIEEGTEAGSLTPLESATVQFASLVDRVIESYGQSDVTLHRGDHTVTISESDDTLHAMPDLIPANPTHQAIYSVIRSEQGTLTEVSIEYEEMPDESRVVTGASVCITDKSGEVFWLGIGPSADKDDEDVQYAIEHLDDTVREFEPYA